MSPGTTYYYLVRAYDSRAASDSNTVVRSAMAPPRPDVQAPAFLGLTSAETGEACGETRLLWSPALESCSLPVVYDVYRSTAAGFEPRPKQRIATTQETSFADFAPEPGRDYSYVIRARDAAGNVEDNRQDKTTQARILDKVLVYTAFELSEARWEVTDPNDAARGSWEWGDPEGSPIQSENDATVHGAKAWITNPAARVARGLRCVSCATTRKLKKLPTPRMAIR